MRPHSAQAGIAAKLTSKMACRLDIELWSAADRDSVAVKQNPSGGDSVMAVQQAAAKATPAKLSKVPAARKSPASPQTALTKPPATKAAAAQPTKPVAAATFTVKQIAAEIAEREQIAKREAETILTGLVGLMVDHLKSGDRLRISGLGILEVKDRPERTGRNPATGEPITIKASKKIAFRPAKELKEAI
jgi:DNA-binding protein HU-beta